MNRGKLTGLLSLVIIMACMISSCGKREAADMSGLLNTIPSDVSALAVFDLGNLLEKAGAKMDGGKVTSTPELNKAIASIKDEGTRRTLQMLVSGDSGVELTGMAVFIEGYNTYVTGTLVDPEAFKAMVEGDTGEKFSDEEISICGNSAVKANQFWLCASSRNSIVKEEVARFAKLDDKQSFLSTVCGPQYVKLSDDVKVWANTNAMMSHGFSSNGAIARMAFSIIFEDPQYLVADLDLDGNQLKMTAKILDSKANTAKFLLPADKIDVKKVETTAGTADLVYALALDSKLINKVKEAAKSFGGSLPAAMLNIISPVDGTIAGSVGADGSLSMVVTTNGDDTSGLNTLLANYGTVKKEGKDLLVNKGTVAGHLGVKSTAAGFKGAMVAVKADVKSVSSRSEQPVAGAGVFRFMQLLLVPEDGGLSARLEGEGVNADTNILRQWISNL